MVNLNDILLHHELECAFVNAQRNNVLFCELGDEGIVYTIYDLNNHLSIVDGGIVEIENLSCCNIYIGEFFAFVQDIRRNIIFDESCMKIKKSAIEQLREYIDELVDLSFTTSVFIHQNIV